MHEHHTCSSLLQSVAQSSVMLPKHWESNEAESVYGFQRSHTHRQQTRLLPVDFSPVNHANVPHIHSWTFFLSALASIFLLWTTYIHFSKSFLKNLMFRHKIIPVINKDLKSSYSYNNNCGFMFCDLLRLMFAACQLLFSLLTQDVFTMFGTRTLCYCHTNNKPFKTTNEMSWNICRIYSRAKFSLVKTSLVILIVCWAVLILAHFLYMLLFLLVPHYSFMNLNPALVHILNY